MIMAQLLDKRDRGGAQALRAHVGVVRIDLEAVGHRLTDFERQVFTPAPTKTRREQAGDGGPLVLKQPRLGAVIRRQQAQSPVELPLRGLREIGDRKRRHCWLGGSTWGHQGAA